MTALNVLGSPLLPCSYAPLTGFMRDGCCHAISGDVGEHLVCVRVTPGFLNHQLELGNDLITPRPELRFRGLKPGDRWCVCAVRWLQACSAGFPATVVLESTHADALKSVSLALLRSHALTPVS